MHLPDSGAADLFTPMLTGCKMMTQHLTSGVTSCKNYETTMKMLSRDLNIITCDVILCASGVVSFFLSMHAFITINALT